MGWSLKLKKKKNKMKCIEKLSKIFVAWEREKGRIREVEEMEMERG